MGLEAVTPDASKVAAHWGRTYHGAGKSFYTHPALRAYFYRCITGHEPLGPLGRAWFEEWVVETFLADREPGEALSLCCGFGDIERILADLGAFRHCRGVDLSPAAIAVARDAAEAAGLHSLAYETVDVERLELEPESLDLVWANGALHHLSRLEHVLDTVARALRPGGHFVANEYVGPDHQQLGLRERELVNAAIHLLPGDLRAQSEKTFVPSRFKGPRAVELAYRFAFGRLPEDPRSGWQGRAVAARRCLPGRRGFRFGKVWDNNPWYYRAVDPSEGVRASQILPLAERFLPGALVRPYNGTILAYALDDAFFRRYDENDPRHVAFLDALVELEESLVSSGEIEPHHAAIVWQKPA